MVWEYGWQERESKRAEESTQLSQVHAVSQAVRPMSLADSGDPGGPGPGQQRGEVDGERRYRSFTDWSMAMDDEVFNHRWTLVFWRGRA